jgi:hypothetical protein
MQAAAQAADTPSLPMNYEQFRKQLAQEAREYLADLRSIIDALKSAEGMFVLALVVSAILITAAWGIVSLGFSPPNEHVMRFIGSLGLRMCRPVGNLAGVVIFINLFLLLFLAVVSVGNSLQMMDRVRKGRGREPRDLIISASLMLLVGIGGIGFMVTIC